MKTIHRDIASALIFSKDGKLFQGKKNPKGGGVYLDCWHIPGGGLDDGDTYTEAIVREVREETGINISNYVLVLVDDVGTGESEKTLPDGEKVLCKMRFTVYKIQLETNAADTKVTLDDELAEYRWTDPKELKDLKLTPPSVELFQRLGYL